MRVLSCLMMVALLVFMTGILPGTALAQQGCKYHAEIDYVGRWGPYYDACYGEMRTTFEYNIEAFGEYRVIWCKVDNTPFSQQYWADLCEPPSSGSVVEGTHCTSSSNHRLMMDVQTCGPNQVGFVYPYKLKADYFEDTPQ